MQDKHLWPVLQAASNQDLEPLQELLSEKSVNWTRPQEATDDHLRTMIHDELLANGGNTFANIVRGSGPPWAEIVRDVAGKLKIAYKTADATSEVEEKVAFSILERAVETMSAEQLEELRDNLNRAGLPRDFPIGQGMMLAGMAAGELAGFASYELLVIVANAIARVLVGRGLALFVNAALCRLLAVVLGPIGWTVMGIWTVIDIAGPAARITIPAVVLVATLRAQQKLKK